MPRMWFYGFLNPENERCAARAGLGLMRAKRFFCDINVWNVFLNVFISWYQAGSHLDFDQLFPSSRGGSSEGCYSVPIWRSLHTQELILAVVSDICIIFILAEVSPAYSHFRDSNQMGWYGVYHSLSRVWSTHIGFSIDVTSVILTLRTRPSPHYIPRKAACMTCLLPELQFISPHVFFKMK